MTENKPLSDTHPSLFIEKSEYHELIYENLYDNYIDGASQCEVGKTPSYVSVEGVQKHTLDKAKVREAIERLSLKTATSEIMREELFKELKLDEEECASE